MLRDTAVHHLRRLRNAAIVIVLGSIVITFVASVHLAIAIQHEDLAPEDEFKGSGREINRRGLDPRDIARKIYPDRDLNRSVHLARMWPGARADIFAYPADPPDSSAKYYDLVQVIESGWPRRCWLGVRVIENENCHDSNGQFRFFRVRMVFLRPLWIPLIESILMLSIAPLVFLEIVWLLHDLVMYGDARRQWRLGRCPKCKYDLRGDRARGCPECGWGRTP